MSSPTQRSLAWLRSREYQAAVVERWNQFAKVRQDLFGFIDLLAIRDGEILAVQATASGVAARIDKIVAEPRSRHWLNAGGLIEVHGWSKKGAAGKRKTYQIRRVRVYLDCGAICWEEVDHE